ncbi:hypothetical protein [Micromonospora sp. NPDC049645]|uniref:hypothetical protein n=1 Tax=Micromonospora sp. NPDC049645 TaxID=3155508 RepID=UPI00343E0813
MTGRRHNPRRAVVAMLRAVKADIDDSLARWRITGNVYVPPADRAPGSPGTRPRAAHEYPEHRAADWEVLDREARHMIEQLVAVREFVAEQLTRLRCGAAGCGRILPPSEAAAGYTTCEHCAPRERAPASREQ